MTTSGFEANRLDLPCFVAGCLADSEPDLATTGGEWEHPLEEDCFRTGDGDRSCFLSDFSSVLRPSGLES